MDFVLHPNNLSVCGISESDDRNDPVDILKNNEVKVHVYVQEQSRAEPRVLLAAQVSQISWLF